MLTELGFERTIFDRVIFVERLADVIKTNIVNKWVDIRFKELAKRNHGLEDTDHESVEKMLDMTKSLQHFYMNNYSIFDLSYEFVTKPRYIEFMHRFMQEMDYDYIEWFVEHHLMDKLEINTDDQLWKFLDRLPNKLCMDFFGSAWYETFLDEWFGEDD